MALNGTLQGAHQQWAKPSDFSGERKKNEKKDAAEEFLISLLAPRGCPSLSRCLKVQAQLMAQDGTSIWTVAKWHGIFDQAGCEHRFTNTTTKRRSIHLGLRTLLYKIGRLSLPWKAKLSIGWDDAMRAGFLDYLSSGNKPLWPQRISNAKQRNFEAEGKLQMVQT